MKRPFLIFFGTVVVSLSSIGVAKENKLWVKAVYVGSKESDVRIIASDQARIGRSYDALSSQSDTAARAYLVDLMLPARSMRFHQVITLFSGDYPVEGGPGYVKFGKFNLSTGLLSKCTLVDIESLGRKKKREFAAAKLACVDAPPEFAAPTIGMTLENGKIADSALAVGDLPNMLTEGADR